MKTTSLNTQIFLQGTDVPISKMLNCLSGNSGLTEEYIYSKIQESQDKKHRLLTGSTDFTDAQCIHKFRHPKNSAKSISTIEGKPIIHVVRKGKAGHVAYFEKGNYTINDDAYLLYLRDDCPYRVSLKWLMYTLKPDFLEYATSSDNGTWNKTRFFKNVALSLPLFDEQNKIVKQYERLEQLHKSIENLRHKIDDLKNKMLIIDYSNFQVKDIPISKVLDCMSGNSGLTEEMIYQKSQVDGLRYTVLSSSTTEETRLGEIPICYINDTRLKVFEDREGILVIRNGKAGTTFFLEKDKYTINDHAYILSLKENIKHEILLKWLMVQYRKDFLEYSSSSDNGTWNKTGFFKNMKIDLPSIDEQKKVLKVYEKLEQLEKKIDNLKNKIESLFAKQISVF